jgi:hypothetical protein
MSADESIIDWDILPTVRLSALFGLCHGQQTPLLFLPEFEPIVIRRMAAVELATFIPVDFSSPSCLYPHRESACFHVSVLTFSWQ